MELSPSIVESLKGRSILVTGATGFLAKLFVEKVLRVQPEVKRIFLLIRGSKEKTAAQRLQYEVLGKEIFKVLSEKHGNKFQSFISDKLCPVPGDIVLEDLGIVDSELRETMLKEVNIIVNAAATTSFDERYDIALNVNTLGSKRLLKFAKQCVGLELFLHVSTAYVAGEKEGLILEEKVKIGESETLNENSELEIDTEVKLMEDSLKKLRIENASEELENSSMKELGLERSKHFGWPNTYVFTKALGEMLLGQLRENIPLVIMRPSIVTGTYKEPVPGWMEGNRTIDTIIIGYAKGKLNCFLGDLDLIMDVIPGDFVINAMIVAMIANLNQPQERIYHVSSSVRNPVKYQTLLDRGHQYFFKNPRVGKDGRIMETERVQVLPTMSSFYRYMTLRYRLPLEGMRLVNAALCRIFSSKYNELNRKYNFVMHLAELYRPYVFFKGCFDDINLERLRNSLAQNESEAMLFNFDAKVIDWDHYFLNIHIPGIMKYVCK